MPERILVVDDEPDVRRVLTVALTARGYAVELATGGQDALYQLRHKAPDVVLLDLMMPDLSGLEVLRHLRTWSKVPVIILSVLADAREKVEALDAGADDYLTKAFEVDELVARIRVALRHAAGMPPQSAIVQAGDLLIDLERRRVTVAGQEVGLSPTEYALLKALTDQAGRVLTHEALLTAVWGPTYGKERNYLHVYIRRLRHKIESDPTNPRYLIAEPGAGYRLQLD